MRLELVSLLFLYISINCQEPSSHKESTPTIEAYSNAFLSLEGNSTDIPVDSVRLFVNNRYTVKDEGRTTNIKDTTIQSIVDSISEVGYPVKNSLPAGYVKNGTVDYTTYLQKAINYHEELIFPNFPILINDQGLQIPSHRKILFLPGSKLVLKPSDKGSYRIIYIKNKSDIVLYNPVIEGDRYGHVGEEGEWGMGISIYSSDNIQIYNADISNCWGDGIYIGQSSIMPPPSNITIVDAYCHNNRRNGITVTSGIDIKLINPITIKSNGVLPMAGIDIEPNNHEAVLKNILIKNPFTANNPGKGIQIGLGRLIERGIKPVTIEISNHNDIGSKNALVVSCNPAGVDMSLINKDTSSESYIKIYNPVWKDNTSVPLRANGFRTHKITFQVTNPRILDSDNQDMNRTAIKVILKKAIGKGGAIDIQD